MFHSKLPLQRLNPTRIMIPAANVRVGKYTECSYETNQMKICFSLMATSCEVPIKDSSSQKIRRRKRVTDSFYHKSDFIATELALAILELTGQIHCGGPDPKHLHNSSTGTSKSFS